jgi:hypothetical protein
MKKINKLLHDLNNKLQPLWTLVELSSEYPHSKAIDTMIQLEVANCQSVLPVIKEIISDISDAANEPEEVKEQIWDYEYGDTSGNYTVTLNGKPMFILPDNSLVVRRVVRSLNTGFKSEQEL